MTATEFAKNIIEGVGGMDSYEEHEVVLWHNSERVSTVVWAMRCLANPECEGSQEAIDAILSARAQGGPVVTEGGERC